MAKYNLKGARFLRMFTAEKLTPAYASNTDAENIVDRLCDVPWKRTYVEDATMTCHSTESQKRGEVEKSGLDWNVTDRESFDAATFCAEHSGGMHRAYANAACYVYALPQMQAYPNLSSIKVKATSDAYNVSGLRIAVKTSDTLDIPTACADCRTGDFHVEGACPHTVVTDAQGNVSWYSKTQDVTLSPASGSTVQLRKYLFVFVLKENYAETRANWLEGSGFIKNSVELTSSSAITGWTDGGTYDCSEDPASAFEYVVCKDGVLPDVDATSCGVVAVNVLASGTQPVQDATTKFVTNIAQVSDELSPANSDMGLRTAYGVLASGKATAASAALCHVNQKRIGAGFCVRQNTDIKLRASAEASPLSPRSIALTASSLCIPFSVPAGLKPKKISFDWSSVAKTWKSMAGMSGTIMCVAYGNGRFVAVGNNGVSYALADGATAWTTLTGGIGTLRGVAYGNGRFVAVGDDGVSFALADGATTWTTLTVMEGTFYSVAYGKGRFVAVGYQGISFALADGATTWTTLTGGIGTLRGVAYGNGRFVAVGYQGVSLALADGATTWTTLTGMEGTFYSVAYGKGRFVAVGNNGVSYALEDGATTWTTLTGGIGTLSRVAYGNGRFITRSGALDDGATTWTTITENLFFTGIAYGNWRFVGVLSDGSCYSITGFSNNSKFNFWIRSGYQDGYAEIPFANPSLYYADGNSAGVWTLLGSVSGSESSASFAIPFDLGRTASVLVTAFIEPENVTPTTNAFSTGAGDFYYNAISADADVTSGSSVVRMFGSDSLMVPDVKLIG